MEGEVVTRVYRWFTATAPRSWVAHALVALGAAAAGGAFGGATWAACGGWLALALYGVKEYRDWRKYRRIKGWRRARWNGINPAQDVFGDLLGPATVAATATLSLLF